MRKVSIIHKKLNELKELLSFEHPEMVAALRSGLPRKQVEAGLATLPFRISPEIVELFTWADGDFDTLIEVLPSGYLLPFHTALDQFHALYPLQKQMDSIFHQPYLDCFRFLHDCSDSGYAFGRLDSASQGCIIHLCIHDEWRLAFPTLEKMLDTAIECHRRGIYKKNGIPDFSTYYALAREMNPDMENWIQ
jgi:hypothetical protein